MYSKELTILIKDQIENVNNNIIGIEFRKLEMLEEIHLKLEFIGYNNAKSTCK